jgi:hypothetical protein
MQKNASGYFFFIQWVFLKSAQNNRIYIIENGLVKIRRFNLLFNENFSILYQCCGGATAKKEDHIQTGSWRCSNGKILLKLKSSNF